MTDYRDRFEEQLVEASHRLSDAPSPPVRRRVRSSRRAFYVSAVGLLCVGTAAVAATRPWQPLLGDPDFPATQATPTASAPPASQLAIFGAFRRPASDADRGSEVLRALEFLGSGTQGARTDYIRSTASLADGGAAVLVPVKSWQPARDEPERRIANAVCVVLAQTAVDAAAKSCWSESAVRSGQATASIGSDFYGIVPDGTATVVATFAGASGLLGSRPTVTAAVVDNVFVLHALVDGADEAAAPRRPEQLEGRDTENRTTLELRP